MTARHIHIVEDDASLREAMVTLMMLREDVKVHGHICATAFLDSPDARESGVLLLDFRMPGMSGMELLSVLRERHSRFVTIMLTGHGTVALAIQAMKLGAFDFLEKPVAPERLQNTVAEALIVLDSAEALHQHTRAAQKRIAVLTARERDVLLGLIDGKSNKIIAFSLGISPRTIEIHRARLMDKMRVDSLSEALRIAFDAGLLKSRIPQ